MKKTHHTYIDRENAKVLATDKDGNHCELDFDYRTIQEYCEHGYDVYATNKNGVYFFLNNRELDGADWCKITKLSS